MLSSAGDSPAVSFWSSGQDSGCAEITETRETALFRATCKREHEVEWRDNEPSNRPKNAKFGVSRKYRDPKKPTTKIMKKVLLEYQ